MDKLKDLKGIIYKIENKINNKVYIGQSLKCFNERYSNGDWFKWTANRHLKSAATKYGVNCFRVEILEHGKSLEELNILEKQYIKMFKSDDRKFGYNKKDGGSNGSFNRETQKKIAEKIRIPFDEFIRRAKEKHGDEYEYFAETYNGSRANIKIRHKKCGRIFMQGAYAHMIGRGCRKCRKRKKVSFETVVKKFHKFDGGEWEYFCENYFDCNSKIKMMHKKCHKITFRTGRYHTKIKRCIYCDSKRGFYRHQPIKFEVFEAKARKVHGDDYIYDAETYKNSATKMKIKHIKCGREFWQSPNTHLNGSGCYVCGHLVSPYLRRKKVIQICPITLKILKEYESGREAARQLKIDNRSINRVCLGQRKTAGGFYWKYANN